MPLDSSSLALLRELAARQGVSPDNADLEAVLGFLDAILPALEDLEQRIPPTTPPAGLYVPDTPA
jgi:hypothetical protein